MQNSVSDSELSSTSDSDSNICSSEHDSDTDSTYVYDGNISNDTVSSEVNSIISEQNKSGLNIYYANADSVLNKCEELQAEINLKIQTLL